MRRLKESSKTAETHPVVGPDSPVTHAEPRRAPAGGNQRAQRLSRSDPIRASARDAALGNLETQQRLGRLQPVGIAPADGALERRADAEARRFLDAPPSSGSPVEGDGGAGRLPSGLRSRMEAHFGADLSNVRLHTGPDAARDASRVGAKAFTFGRDIVFGAGRYDPGSARGLHLLAHEVAHAVQHARNEGRGLVHRAPEDGGEAGRATLDDLVREKPPGFHDPLLEVAYQSYLRTNKAAADPRTWAVHVTRGSPRERLVKLLGPDYARGQRADRPSVDVSTVTPPASYLPARRQQDLAALAGAPDALGARLSNLQHDPQTGMRISAGHYAILQGNVGEVLARPLLEKELEEVRKTVPEAQLFLGVTAQLRMQDGGWTNAVQFSDGIIGRIDARGLHVLRLFEIKSGPGGGAQGQVQIHRWIEAHGTWGLRILLPGVARTFEYSDAVREVHGFTVAPRSVVVPSDARFLGPRSGHHTPAPTTPLRMAQSAGEIAYLTGATGQRLLHESQARRILAEVQARQLHPVELSTTLELQRYDTFQRLQAESRGLALVNGELYRVVGGPDGRVIQRLPLQPLQLPPQTGSSPSNPLAPVVPPAPSPSAPALRSGPLSLPGLPGSVEVAPGVRMPTNVINVSGQDVVVGGGRLVPPSEPVELRQGDIVVRGESARWTAIDARTGRPLAAVFEGGQFYTVVRAGAVVSIGEDGRTVSVSSKPTLVPLTSAPAGGAATANRSGATRGVAAGAGIFVAVNEILGSIGRNLQQQRANIAMGQARIDFWVRFGGYPVPGIWDIGERSRLADDAKAETEVFGTGSYPYVVSIDVDSFASTLPGLITSYRDYLLFLDMAKVLGTIVEEPTMPPFPSAEERREPRRYYAKANDGRISHDVTDLIVSLGERLLGTVDDDMRASLSQLSETQRRNVFRLKHGSETPLFRSARGGQPILTDEQLLGEDPWVRTLGRELEGGVRSWFFHGQWRDRVLVAPANADAMRASLVSGYVIKKEPDEVLEEVRAGNREIISRSPPDGEVVSFVAGPEPGDSRFGETRYYRHTNWPRVRWTIALGELRQFWVNERDLEPVPLQDVESYAARERPR